ncbi:MAG: hypothetical protein R3C12_19515 [Planctomycetaceae bacterium]
MSREQGSKSTAQADDFEMENWQFIYNMPKSSREQDENTRAARILE